MEKEHTCCFFGHRKIKITEELENRLKNVVEDLIVNKKVSNFLFGSKSEFDNLCLKIVTDFKKKHSHIKRIYVRAEYPFIDENYEKYLLKKYDCTYYPKQIVDAGKASYVERNYEMIDKSNYCIVYYDEKYIPQKRKNKRQNLFDYQPKSGTKIAYNYAVKKEKMIVNVI
jgi:uncharacterized phage-like protein YoqJ